MNGPLHIVHVAGGAQWTGGERFLLQTVDRLDPRNFRLSIVLPEKGLLEEELKKRSIPFRVVPLNAWGNPAAVLALSRLFKEWRPQIIQGHGVRANVYARLAAGNIPCIATVHNALSDDLSLPVRWIKRAADTLTAFRSTAVVCTAECLREEFLKRCPSLWEKTFVIPTGVDMDKFDPARQNREAVRRELRLGDRWTMALIARMAEGKGHDFLLDALGGIKSTLPDFQLLLAGDGPLRGRLAEKVRALGLEENVRFLGVRRDVPALLAAADVVISPLVSEGFPYVLLESMAMGRPTVAYQVNGVGEIMPTEAEGYVVPTHAPEKLVEALLTTLWNKEDAKARADAGRRLMLREFDLKRTMAKWEALYRRLSGDILIE
jgi:glycosyltransferase involved in cell wall biosynthesis